MDTITICCIVAIPIILICIICFIIIGNRSYRKNKSEALSILSKLKDPLYGDFIGIIEGYDYSKESNLNEIEIVLIDKMIASGLRYIQTELKKSSEFISKPVAKILSNELFLIDYIESVINNIDIFKSVEEQLGPKYQELMNTFAKEESELKKEYSDESIYYINDKNIVLDPATEKPPTEEELEEISKLNPQIEDEEEFNSEDESMEVIGEESDNVIIDSMGVFRDKLTGKEIKKK